LPLQIIAEMHIIAICDIIILLAAGVVSAPLNTGDRFSLEPSIAYKTDANPTLGGRLDKRAGIAAITSRGGGGGGDGGHGDGGHGDGGHGDGGHGEDGGHGDGGHGDDGHGDGGHGDGGHGDGYDGGHGDGGHDGGRGDGGHGDGGHDDGGHGDGGHDDGGHDGGHGDGGHGDGGHDDGGHSHNDKTTIGRADSRTVNDIASANRAKTPNTTNNKRAIARDEAKTTGNNNLAACNHGACQRSQTRTPEEGGIRRF
jgi:hypothetical protein